MSIAVGLELQPDGGTPALQGREVGRGDDQINHFIRKRPEHCLSGNNLLAQKREHIVALAQLLERNRMTPVHSRGRSGRRYRYYVSGPLQTGGDVPRDIRRRIPAVRIEELLVTHLREWSLRPDAGWAVFTPWLRRIDVHSGALVVTLVPPGHERWLKRIEAPSEAQLLASGELRITVPATIVVRGGRSRITGSGLVRTRPDPLLISGLRRAHAVLASRGVDLLDRQCDFASATGIEDPYNRSLVPLAFLAPDIQQAILAGRQAEGMGMTTFTAAEIPLCWKAQRQMFGMHEGRT